MSTPVRRPWLPWALALLVFGEVLGLAWLRYGSLGWDMADLANMTQAVWNTTQGRVLVYTAGGVARSRLVEHAEVLYLAFVPLFWRWPSPLVLVVGQALVFASGVVPAYRLGQRHHGSGLWTALFYALYPGAQTAVLFDVHGDPFGAAFLVWALDAWDARRPRAFLFWLMAALTTKIYVALAALALMTILAWERRAWPRPLRWATALSLLWLIGVGWGLKHFWPASSSNTFATFLDFRYGNAWQAVLPSLGKRLIHGLAAILPAWPWVRYPQAWPAVVLVIAAMSTRRQTYLYTLHHYALAGPFLLYAFVRFGQQPGLATALSRAWTRITLLVGFGALVVGGLYVLAPAHLPIDRRAWQRGRQTMAWAQKQVAPQSPLLVTHNIAPFFATRPWLSADIVFPTRAQAQEVLIDAFWEGKDGVFMAAVLPLLNTLRSDGQWQLVGDYDGLLHWRRMPMADDAATLGGTIGVEPVQQACAPFGDQARAADFGNGLRLRCARLTPGAANTVQVTLVWQRDATQRVPSEHMVAIAVIGTWPQQGERKILLNSWLQLPPQQWPTAPHTGVVERTTWRLRLPPGCYPVRLAWYRVGEVGTYYPAHAASQRWGQVVVLGALDLRAEPGRVVEHCPQP